MKKLLFTLAAFLIAGTAFAADNYCYIEDIVLTEADLQAGEIEVPVAVHADQYFSGWQVTVLMPEGMEITDYESGDDNKGIPYLNKTGKSKTTDASCGANDAYNMFLGAIQEAGYTQVDGVWTSYGAVCWAPDEYEEIVLLTVSVAEDFKGGEITVKSKLSNTPSELFTETFGPSATGVEFTKTTTVTVEGGQEESKDLAGEVNVTVDENGNITATYTPAEGEPAEGYTCVCDPAKMDDYGTVAVTVTVTPEAEGYNPTAFDATATWTKPEPKKLQGEITISDHVDGAFTVTYDGDENVTITCTITKQGSKATTEGYNLPGYGTYDVYAKATANDAEYEGDYVETTKVLVWNEPAPKELKGEVFVSVDENGNITAQYAPAEGEPTEGYTITTDPTKLNDYGTYTVTYTVEHEGYEPLEDSQSVTWSAPVTEQTAAPGDDLQNKVVKFGDVYYNTYELTLIETEPSTIYYRVGTLNPETGLFEYTDWMTYEDMLTYTTPGTYMVEAYAVADGKTQSTTIQVGFSVSEATSIEELFADKNIASVRYFNMAGQEMQEANGICVTVYTFTDGTQTAIKVMK